MPYLTVHTCPLPAYHYFWLVDETEAIASGQLPMIWECDDCGKLWKRKQQAAWREVETKVDIWGKWRWVAQWLNLPLNSTVMHKVNTWKIAGWTALSSREARDYIKKEVGLR